MRFFPHLLFLLSLVVRGAADSNNFVHVIFYGNELNYQGEVHFGWYKDNYQNFVQCQNVKKNDRAQKAAYIISGRWIKYVCFWEHKNCFGKVKCFPLNNDEVNNVKLADYGMGNLVSSVSVEHHLPMDESPSTNQVTVYKDRDFQITSWKRIHVNSCQALPHDVKGKVSSLTISPLLSKQCVCFHRSWDCSSDSICYSAGAVVPYVGQEFNDVFGSISLSKQCNYQPHYVYSDHPVLLLTKNRRTCENARDYSGDLSYICPIYLGNSGLEVCVNLNRPAPDYFYAINRFKIPYSITCICYHRQSDCRGLVKCHRTPTNDYDPGSLIFLDGLISLGSISLSRKCYFEWTDLTALSKPLHLDGLQVQTVSFSTTLSSFCQGMEKPQHIYVKDGNLIPHFESKVEMTFVPTNECDGCMLIIDSHWHHLYFDVKTQKITRSTTKYSHFRVYHMATWDIYLIELMVYNQNGDRQFLSIHPFKQEIIVTNMASECSFFRKDIGGHKPVINVVVDGLDEALLKSAIDVKRFVNQIKITQIIALADKLCNAMPESISGSIDSFCLAQRLPEFRKYFNGESKFVDISSVVEENINEKLKAIFFLRKYSEVHDSVRKLSDKIHGSLKTLIRLSYHTLDKLQEITGLILESHEKQVQFMKQTSDGLLQIKSSAVGFDLASYEVKLNKLLVFSKNSFKEAEQGVSVLVSRVERISKLVLGDLLKAFAVAMAKLASAIMGAMNPLNLGNAGDIADATNGVVVATSNLANFATLKQELTKSINQIQSTLNSLFEACSTLGELLITVNKIKGRPIDNKNGVKSYASFLNQYNDFTMGESNSKVVVVFSKFKGIISALCGLGTSLATSQCAQVSGDIAHVEEYMKAGISQGYGAVETMVKIAKSLVQQNSIQKFKKDLQVNFNSAQLKIDINHNSKDWLGKSALKELFWKKWEVKNRNYLLKFKMEKLLNRINMVEMSKLACQSFLYQNGNKPIQKCAKVLSGHQLVTPYQLADLASYQIDDDMKKVGPFIAYLPTLPDPEFEYNGAFINVQALQRGLKSYVQIPQNATWLRKYKWIYSEQEFKQNVYYFKSINLFLPPFHDDVNTHERFKINIKFDATIPFGPAAASKIYKVGIEKSVTLQYGGDQCRVKTPNVYKQCINSLPDYCIHENGDLSNPKYPPTIYTKFLMSATSSKSSVSKRIPFENIATPMLLKVEVELYSRQNNRNSFENIPSEKCCQAGEYLTSWGHSNTCAKCPKDTKSQYNGLFCSVESSTVPSFTPTPSIPVDRCRTEINMDYNGEVIQRKRGLSVAGCCAACEKGVRCVAFSFMAKDFDGQSSCYLKSTFKGKVKKEGIISGTTIHNKTPQPSSSNSKDIECLKIVSTGDKRVGISAIHDEKCKHGGLGCWKHSSGLHCRSCKVKETKQSKHLKKCSEYK